MPLPLTVFGFLDRGQAIFGGGAEDWEEHLHEWVIGVVVCGPFAVDDAGEGGLVGAGFEGERHEGGWGRI